MIGNLLALDKISVYQLSELLDLTFKIKENPDRFKNSLSGFIIAGLFQNPSFHSRVSFQIAVSSLKGKTLFLKYSDLQTEQRKLSRMFCKFLERWIDGIVIEIKNHEHITELEQTVRIPLINAGSEKFSPCQALADFFTIKEHYKDLTNIKLAFIGNQRNICHSLLLASATAGTYIHIATPPENKPEKEVIDIAEIKGKNTGFNYRITADPQEASLNADIIYYSFRNLNSFSKTKTNFSFKNKLLSIAKDDALFMFNPAFQDWEKTPYKNIPADRSLIFSQIDNRLHIEKAIMVSLIKEKKREI
jgi:ornithine carbamoyltransferase